MNPRDKGAKMKNIAQSTIEYVVMVSLIVAALFAMQVYLKRGLAGRMRSSADEVGGGYFYSPGAMQDSTTTIDTTVSIQSNSYVTDLEDSTDYKKSIMDTKIESGRATSREEEVLPFSAEPARW
ncbi:MAG: hypothetical protein PHT50_02500 [Candidatus Omnitrophica bacterium]|nr:hypothetical protein [Candidatus Omnitrophota bacterium]